jgi:hypothetical protein
MPVRYLNGMAQSSNSAKSLAELYPMLSPEELQLAQENIDRYLNLVLRVAGRVKNDSNDSAASMPSDSATDLAS